jgi:hypothetical protein
MGAGGHHIGVIASSRRGDKLWTNLIRWWKFTETSGDAVEYAIGGGTFDATIFNATQTSSGLDLDGTADWANINIPGMGTDDFTIIMRINPTAQTVSRCILGGDTDCFILAYDASEGLIAAQDEGSSSNATNLTMNTGSVNMIAVIRSGNTFRFFINGLFENETLTADFTTAISFLAGSNHTYLNRMIGIIRDLCYFNDAKSDAYITAFYNSGSYTEYEDGDPI